MIKRCKYCDCFLSSKDEHISDGDGICKVKFADNDIYYYRNGVTHRDDGPAVIYANGHKEWYKNGYPHKEHGYAIEFPDGGGLYAKIIGDYHVYFHDDYTSITKINYPCEDKYLDIYFVLPLNVSEQRIKTIMTYL